MGLNLQRLTSSSVLSTEVAVCFHSCLRVSSTLFSVIYKDILELCLWFAVKTSDREDSLL